MLLVQIFHDYSTLCPVNHKLNEDTKVEGTIWLCNLEILCNSSIKRDISSAVFTDTVK